MKNKRKKVFVGMSGGVDSSVSALLLKQQNYDVYGVFIRTWSPDFIKCNMPTERRDAMRVCAHLNIPFLECDAREIYKKKVVDYMINEYKKGNTPNPDIMCNREVKFKVFWDFAKSYNADYIATGHYARNNYELTIKNYELKKGVDPLKDQVYFLWTLTQDDLVHTLFPVGHLKKEQVRKIATKYKIPVATKKDSQGVCFLGQIDMKDFLKHYIKTKKGNVLNEEGEIIGHHDGAIFFTLGERHGFTINKNTKNQKPLYVISKDIVKNTIVVSDKLLSSQSTNKKYCLININWIKDIPKERKKYTAQIRYHGEYLKCNLVFNKKDVNKIEINFKKNTMIDKGQSVVIYDKDICLGGGIVG
jgi:tRNA-specific 2-thiouridylase